MTAESENHQKLEKPSILSSSLKVGALCGKSRFSCFFCLQRSFAASNVVQIHPVIINLLLLPKVPFYLYMSLLKFLTL